jgi:hypothetical protein
MSSFNNVAEVLNAFGVGVFPVKSQPGKFTTSFINSQGKRQFLDRKQVAKTDGSQSWVWVVGKELAPKASQPVQAQIQIG